MQESQGITQNFLTRVPKATLEEKTTVYTETAIHEVKKRGSSR